MSMLKALNSCLLVRPLVTASPNDNAVLMLQNSACKQASMGRKKLFKYITKSAALCNQLGSHFVTQVGKGLFILSLKSVVRSLLPTQNDQE